MLALALDDVNPSTLPNKALNLSVFRCDESGRLIGGGALSTDSSYVTSNKGIYTNPACGVTTGEFRADEGYYLVVPSTFDPLVADYTITAYSDSKIAFI